MKKIKYINVLVVLICLTCGGCAGKRSYVQTVDLNNIQDQKSGKYVIRDDKKTRDAYTNAAKKQETGNGIIKVVLVGGVLLLLL